MREQSTVCTSTNRQPSTVDRQQLLRHQDALIWTCILLVGCALSVLTWNISNPLHPDGCQYMFGGCSIVSGKGYLDMSHQPQTIFPPGYPLSIGLAAKLVSNPVVAAKLVSTVSSVLTVIPLCLLIRRFFGRRVGYATALIYMVLPARLAAGSAVFSESLYLLLLLSAVWLWSCELDSFSAWRSACVGVALGAAYLVRPDALACASVLILMSIPVHRWWNTLQMRSLIVILAAMVLPAASYVVYLHSTTGQWALTSKASINHNIGIARSTGVKWEKTVRLDASAARIDFSSFTESKTRFPVRYARNLAREIDMLRENLGWFLTVCLVLGLVAERFRYGVVLRQAMPMLVALSVPIAYIPAYFVVPRFVFPATIPLVALACWQLMTRFRPLDSPQAVRARALALLPLMIVSLSFLKTDLYMARNPEPSAVDPSLAAWIGKSVPPTSALMDLNPERAFVVGRKWFPLPYETITRTLHYARYNNVEYILLRSGNELSPDLAGVAQGRPYPGLRLVSQWHGAGGSWAKLYLIGSSRRTG